MFLFLKRLTRAVRILTKLFVVFAAFIFLAPAIAEKGRNTVSEHTPYPVSVAAQTLHDSLLIGDWHADSLLWNRDLTERGMRGHVDLPRLIEGNVSLQAFTVVTKSPKGQNYENTDADAKDNITLLVKSQMWPRRTWNSLLERALYQAKKLEQFQAKAPDQLHIIRNKTELEALLSARTNGEQAVGALLGIEGAHALEGKIENLDLLEEAGFRIIGLQHFFDNELGGTLHSPKNNGLTDFGREVVAEVAKRGMVLDLAHSSQQVVQDVLAIADMPVIISHTGIFSHCLTKRNLPDDLMRVLASTGSVIGIGFWDDVTCDNSPDGVAATIKAAIDLLGDNAVSLGSDYDGAVNVGFDTSEMAALTDALMRAGLSDLQIRKVMGDNMLRILRARLKG